MASLARTRGMRSVPRSPCAKSLTWLRQEGWTPEKVETWNPFARRRHDLFGFADILAFRADPPSVLLVQATTRSNLSARLKKIHDSDLAQAWLRAGFDLEVHGWQRSQVWIRNLKRGDRVGFSS